ncbi:MAG: hypothetical protein Q9195_006445 [Heterodermia aff. obscurata]
MTQDSPTNSIQTHAPTMQPSPDQSIEISFVKTLSTLERLCNIRCRLLETKDTPYSYEAINDVIMGKIIELHSMTQEFIYLGLEDDLLSEVERMVEVRKTLVDTHYPIGKTLGRLEQMINEVISYLR